MNEAKQMHHDRMTALLPILPRTAYHDVRRVSTLVWALTGLCLTQTVRPAYLRAMHRMQPAVCAAFPAGYIIQPSSLRSGIHPSSRQRLRDWPRNTRFSGSGFTTRAVAAQCACGLALLVLRVASLESLGALTTTPWGRYAFL